MVNVAATDVVKHCTSSKEGCTEAEAKIHISEVRDDQVPNRSDSHINTPFTPTARKRLSSNSLQVPVDKSKSMTMRQTSSETSIVADTEYYDSAQLLSESESESDTKTGSSFSSPPGSDDPHSRPSSPTEPKTLSFQIPKISWGSFKFEGSSTPGTLTPESKTSSSESAISDSEDLKFQKSNLHQCADHDEKQFPTPTVVLHESCTENPNYPIWSGHLKMYTSIMARDYFTEDQIKNAIKRSPLLEAFDPIKDLKYAKPIDFLMLRPLVQSTKEYLEYLWKTEAQQSNVKDPYEKFNREVVDWCGKSFMCPSKSSPLKMMNDQVYDGKEAKKWLEGIVQEFNKEQFYEHDFFGPDLVKELVGKYIGDHKSSSKAIRPRKAEGALTVDTYLSKKIDPVYSTGTHVPDPNPTKQQRAKKIEKEITGYDYDDIEPYQNKANFLNPTGDAEHLRQGMVPIDFEIALETCGWKERMQGTLRELESSKSDIRMKLNDKTQLIEKLGVQKAMIMRQLHDRFLFFGKKSLPQTVESEGNLKFNVQRAEVGVTLSRLNDNKSNQYDEKLKFKPSIAYGGDPKKSPARDVWFRVQEALHHDEYKYYWYNNEENCAEEMGPGNIQPQQLQTLLPNFFQHLLVWGYKFGSNGHVKKVIADSDIFITGVKYDTDGPDKSVFHNHARLWGQSLEKAIRGELAEKYVDKGMVIGSKIDPINDFKKQKENFKILKGIREKQLQTLEDLNKQLMNTQNAELEEDLERRRSR